MTSTEWARYVLYHRLELCGDRCRGRHADTVAGPIADNAIANWIKRFKERPDKSIESCVEEFRAFITSAQDGWRLTEAQLGTQIAFCNPELAGAILQVAKIEYFGPAEGWKSMEAETYIAECMVKMYPSVTFEQAVEWIREYERFLVTIMEHESGYSVAEAVVS